MRGDLAPEYWAAGRRQEVLEYVAQDVQTTLTLAQQVEAEPRPKLDRPERPTAILTLEEGLVSCAGGDEAANTRYILDA